MRVRGTCIWFNERKGYGFIKNDNGDESFIHYKNIKERCYKSLYRGQRVTYEELTTDRGLSAVNLKYEKDFKNL